MCIHEDGPDNARQWVRAGLPPCLTEVGIVEVMFRPGTSYHTQEVALARLCALPVATLAGQRDTC